MLGRIRRDLKSLGWSRAEFGQFVARVGWPTLLPKLRVDRILLMAASNDRFFDPRVVERMWKR